MHVYTHQNSRQHDKIRVHGEVVCFIKDEPRELQNIDIVIVNWTVFLVFGGLSFPQPPH